MTTQEFIAKNLGNTPSKTKHHASVMQDTNGQFYSYGLHYPLLFKIDNQWFVNVRGYSNTTTKHINHAHAACPQAIPVVLSGSDRLPLTLDDVKMRLNQQLYSIRDDIQTKKHKNTQVYKDLFHQFNRVSGAINQLSEA